MGKLLLRKGVFWGIACQIAGQQVSVATAQFYPYSTKAASAKSKYRAVAVFQKIFAWVSFIYFAHVTKYYFGFSPTIEMPFILAGIFKKQAESWIWSDDLILHTPALGQQKNHNTVYLFC